jgi:hypothetical protein
VVFIKEKLLLIILIALIAIMLLIRPVTKIEDNGIIECQKYCKVYNSDIRMSEKGICICQK